MSYFEQSQAEQDRIEDEHDRREQEAYSVKDEESDELWCRVGERLLEWTLGADASNPPFKEEK